jgi:hypothetical protein
MLAALATRKLKHKHAFLNAVQPWFTDCMNHGGVSAFVVGFRNNRNTSLYMDDFKCRIFQHSLVLANPSVVWYHQVQGFYMKCNDGSVCTAFLYLPFFFILFNTWTRFACSYIAIHNGNPGE